MPDNESIRDILMRARTGGDKGSAAKPPGDTAPPDSEPEGALTIAAMDGKYSTQRPAHKELARLHVVKKDGAVISFQYGHLDARSTFEGGSFVVLFVGVKHWQVTVTGRGKDMWRIYDYLSLKRWPYLREATRDFGDDSETVLTAIEITDVTPKDPQ